MRFHNGRQVSVEADPVRAHHEIDRFAVLVLNQREEAVAINFLSALAQFFEISSG